MSQEPSPDTFTLNDSEASKPGGIPLQHGVYSRCFPGKAVLLLLAALVVLAVAIGLGMAGQWRALTAWVVFAGGGVVFAIRRVEEQFRHGDVNPSRVMSLNPPLIAVLADLNTGAGPSRPFVKVVRQPLERLSGGSLRLGDNAATVALYKGKPEKGVWDDIDPVLTACGTRDEAQIQRVLSSIPPDQWASLDAALTQVPTPIKAGLYPVFLPSPQPKSL